MSGERNGPEVHEDLALAVARGVPLVRWAKQQGIPERTARDWASKPEFKATVASVRRRIIDRTVGKLVASSTAAVTAMVRIMERSNNDYVKLTACRTILEQTLSWSSHHDLEQRLAALEEEVRERAEESSRNGRR
jgi:hypothetical protein